MTKNSSINLFMWMSLIANIVLGILVVITAYKPVETLSGEAQKKIYPFLSPRVFINDPNDVLINFVALRKSVRSMLANVEYPVGMYFEYLPSGVWFGVNEKVGFFSTNSIPFLDQLQKLRPETNLYSFLDFPESQTQADRVVSPKNFSSVLRNLYLATYLDLETSNQILQSHVIHIGSTPVADFRFEEEKLLSGRCSVVYRDKRPFIVCMMAKTNSEQLEKLFNQVLKEIDEYVDAY